MSLALATAGAGAIGKLAGPIIGGLFSANSAKKDRELQKESLAHQIFMDKNGVQVRMEDLKKAGINPLLAGVNPADGSANVSPVGDNGAGTQFGNAINSALQAKATTEQIKNVQADTALKDAQSGKTGSEQQLVDAQRNVQIAQEKLTQAGTATEKARAKKELEQANLIMQEALKIEKEHTGTKVEQKFGIPGIAQTTKTTYTKNNQYR